MRIAITLMDGTKQRGHFAIEVNEPPAIHRIGQDGWWYVPAEEELHEAPYPVQRTWLYTKEDTR